MTAIGTGIPKAKQSVVKRDITQLHHLVMAIRADLAITVTYDHAGH